MKKIDDLIELPTLGLILASYSVWVLLILCSEFIPLPVWVILFALNITLFLSITHEVIHGHPTQNALVNRLLLLFPIGWIIPYERFRDTHIAHHYTDELTDPFDDPESWYHPNFKYENMNKLMRYVLTFNNTLLGRMLIGPLISLSKFYASEFQQIITTRSMRNYLLIVWCKHLILCLMMAWFINTFTTLPLWVFVVSIYLSLSVLLIRTFLEHQAAHDHYERTVIIEKCCPLAFLFLYNNLHAVHHEKPGVAWYKLPALYRTNSQDFKKLNHHYVYKSYGEIFRKYFLTPKEDIAHPFLRREPH